MDDVIIYEELVKEYNESLNSVLRGFRPKYDFLELWVPESDAALSLKSLVEAADGQNQKSLSIFLGKATLAALNLDALVKDLQRFGKVEQVSENGGKTLHLNRAAGTSELEKIKEEIHPLYREKILELFGDRRHQGSILEDGDNLMIRSNKDGISLFGAIDTHNHRIARARFSGTNKVAESALLEGLCRIIEGIPIQEACDHAIIKLEYQTRDKTQARPVSGIVNVFNYPPMFELPLKLMRDLFATYVSKTGYQPSDNYYAPSPSPQWTALSDQEKMAAIVKVFREMLAKKGAAYSGLALELEISQIDFHKVYAAIRGEIAMPVKAKLYMDLERTLREEVEATLQIFSENIK